MSNRTDKDKDYIRQLVREYIKINGVPDTLKMQWYLTECGYDFVSTGTIANIYRELGYMPKRQPSFIWKKESHE